VGRHERKARLPPPGAQQAARAGHRPHAPRQGSFGPNPPLAHGASAADWTKPPPRPGVLTYSQHAAPPAPGQLLFMPAAAAGTLQRTLMLRGSCAAEPPTMTGADASQGAVRSSTVAGAPTATAQPQSAAAGEHVRKVHRRGRATPLAGSQQALGKVACVL
jgi:hypothetical protein